LKLKHDKPLSNVDFNFNVRRYNKDVVPAAKYSDNFAGACFRCARGEGFECGGDATEGFGLVCPGELMCARHPVLVEGRRITKLMEQPGGESDLTLVMPRMPSDVPVTEFTCQQPDVWEALEDPADRFEATDEERDAACARQDLVSAQITRTRHVLVNTDDFSDVDADHTVHEAAGALGYKSAPRHPRAALGHVSGHLWGRHPDTSESAGESALTHVRCARGSRLPGAPAVEGAPCGHTPGAHEHVVCPADHACIAASAVAVDLDLRRFFKPVARHVCVTEARAAAITGVERGVFPFPAVKDSDLARVVADVCEGPSALGRTVEVAVIPASRYHHAGQPRLGMSGVEAASYEYTVSLCGTPCK